MTGVAQIVTPEPEVVALADRLKRNDAADQALRAAFNVLGPLIRDLPATDDLLLSSYSVTAWRTLRDHHPDLYLVYRSAVRSKCGRHVTDLLDNHIGPPQSGPVRTIALSTVADVLAQSPPAWLVYQVLPELGLVVVYGETQSGKTFSVLSMIGAVVRGVDWFGRATNPGAGIYISAEGRLRDRLDAYIQANSLTADDLRLLHIIEESIDLSGNTRDLDQIIARIAEVREKHGIVAMVVIDTVARVMPGADENSGKDMGALINAMRRIGDAAGGVVLAIHHTGKDATRGARGHSSLRAAADAEIEVTRDESGVRTARVTKLRDAEDGAAFAFRLEAVPVGINGCRSSCVVVPCDAPARPAKAHRLTDYERIALDALKEEIAASGEIRAGSSVMPAAVRSVHVKAWGARFYARMGEAREVGPGAKRQAFFRTKGALIGKKLVGAWEEYAWMI